MKKIGTVLLGLLLLFISAGAAQAEIRIGVLAKRGATKAMTKWQDTGDFLSEKLGESVVIIPLNFSAIVFAN